MNCAAQRTFASLQPTEGGCPVHLAEAVRVVAAAEARYVEPTEKRMSVTYQADVEARLRGVDWSQLTTAYGSAHRIPEWLWDLRFASPMVADEGGHMLWCSLCHQKGQLASAAEPALPFLLEFLPSVRPDLQIEILDILHGFALCSYPGNGYPSSGYHARTRAMLRAALPRILPFAQHESEDAQYFVREAVAVLEDSSG